VTNSAFGAQPFSFSGLGAGASVTQDFFCHAGTDTATADSGGAVGESIETNNTDSISVVSCIA